MPTQSLLITLAVVGVPCAIAVLLARRWQLHLMSAWLVSAGWSAASIVAYHFIMSARPPVPWTPAALDAEPWESVVYPIALIALLWPLIKYVGFESRYVTSRTRSVGEAPSSRSGEIRDAAVEAAHQSTSLNILQPQPGAGELLVVLIASCLPLLAAQCTTERFASFLIGNTPWTLAALMAVGMNWLAMRWFEGSGAGRWSLWVVVGQSLTVAALIMTCYGRFGEWATAAGLVLAVVALTRVCVNHRAARWSISLAVPALALSSVLIMHIREYRSAPLPLWFPALPFLLPAIVACIDFVIACRLHPLVRVVVAGVATAVVGAATIAIILAFNGPTEDW